MKRKQVYNPESNYCTIPSMKYNQVAHQMRLENYKDNQVEIQKAICDLRQTEKLLNKQLDDLENKSGKKPVSRLISKARQERDLSDSTLTDGTSPYSLGQSAYCQKNNIERISHMYQYETSDMTNSIFATEIEDTNNNLNDIRLSSNKNLNILGEKSEHSKTNYQVKYKRLKEQCIKQQKIIESLKKQNLQINQQQKSQQSDLYSQMNEQIRQAKIEIENKNRTIKQLQEKLSKATKASAVSVKTSMQSNSVMDAHCDTYELTPHPIKQYKYLCNMLDVDPDEFDQQWNKVFRKIAELQNQIIAIKRTVSKNSVDKHYDEFLKQLV